MSLSQNPRTLCCLALGIGRELLARKVWAELPPNDMLTHLSSFIGRLQSSDHFLAASMADWTAVALVPQMVTSSAYIAVLTEMIFGRSFIYIKNRRGPSTEPWGTPDDMGEELDREGPVRTENDRSDKNPLIKESRFPEMP